MTPEGEHREKGQREYQRETSKQSAQDCIWFPVSDMLTWSYCEDHYFWLVARNSTNWNTYFQMKPNFKSPYEEHHIEQKFSEKEKKKSPGHQDIRDGKRLLLRGGKNPTEQDAGPDISVTSTGGGGRSCNLCASSRDSAQTPQHSAQYSLPASGLDRTSNLLQSLVKT